MGKANPSGGICRRIPHTIFDMLDKQDCSRYNYDEDPGLVSSPRGPAESMSGARLFCGRVDKESRKGRMADALAHGGDEGRDKLR